MLEELTHWLSVVEKGSFTAAARAAPLTQPALSAAIKRLEEHFGARLLERGRKGAQLTAAGAALLPHARGTLAALENGRRAVHEVEELSRGEVRIAAGATAATYLLPPVLARFRKRYPGVKIVLRELSRVEASEALERGDLDLAVMSGPKGERWRRDTFVIVKAPGSRTEGAPFLTFPVGTVTREVLDRHFPDAEIVMELSSIAAVKGHVAEGIGVALISRAAINRDLASKRLTIVRHPLTPIHRDLVLMHRGAERLPPAARALRELLLAMRD